MGWQGRRGGWGEALLATDSQLDMSREAACAWSQLVRRRGTLYAPRPTGWHALRGDDCDEWPQWYLGAVVTAGTGLVKSVPNLQRPSSGCWKEARSVREPSVGGREYGVGVSPPSFRLSSEPRGVTGADLTGRSGLATFSAAPVDPESRSPLSPGECWTVTALGTTRSKFSGHWRWRRCRACWR